MSGKPQPRRTRATNAVDVYVGQRIRARRKELNISQTELGGRLGITFQQVQKYENGLNRVASATLFELAAILDLPMRSFFPQPIGKTRDEPDDLHEIRLAYLQLSEKARALLLSAVRALVAEEAKPQKRQPKRSPTKRP